MATTEPSPHNSGSSGSAAAIAGSASRGAATFAGRTALIQAMQLVSSLALARLVLPSEYGIYAAAAIGVAVMRYVGDLGISQLLSVRPTVNAEDLRSGSFVSVMTSAAGLLLLCALSPWVASALDGPAGTVWVMAALASTLLTDSLRPATTVKLNRSLEFGRLGAVAIIESLALYAAQILLLLLGFGIWALVIGQACRSIVGTAALHYLARGLVMPRRSRALAPLVRASLPYQGPALLVGALGAAVPIILGGMLGAQGLGLWAWSTVLVTPLLSVLAAIHGVAMPSLARLRDHHGGRNDEATRMISRVTLMLSAICVGTLVGFTPDIVQIVFGDRWIGATHAVQIALLGAIPASIAVAYGADLDARMRPKARLGAIAISSAVAVVLLVPFVTLAGVTGAAICTGLIAPGLDAALIVRLTGGASVRMFIPASFVLGLGVVLSTIGDRFVNGLVDLVVGVVATGIALLAAAVLADGAVLRRTLRLARAGRNAPIQLDVTTG